MFGECNNFETLIGFMITPCHSIKKMSFIFFELASSKGVNAGDTGISLIVGYPCCYLVCDLSVFVPMQELFFYISH